jgi:hypothetical protein
MIDHELKEILECEYQKLEDINISATGKVNLLNNIVQFKLNESEFQNFKNDLSIDIKRYLNSLVELAENGARNYDIINDDKIEFLESVEYKDKIKYIEYFIRILENSSFKDDIKKLQKFKYKVILKDSLSNFWKFQSIFKIIIYYPLYNTFSLFISLILITLFANLILLPAPLEKLAFLNYDIEYLNLTENRIFNHFINVTSALIGVNNKFNITPLDGKSMFFLILGKIFIFSYVVTLIFNKITDLIKR